MITKKKKEIGKNTTRECWNFIDKKLPRRFFFQIQLTVSFGILFWLREKKNRKN